MVRPRHDRPGRHRVVAVPRVNHASVENDALGTLGVHLDAVTTCVYQVNTLKNYVVDHTRKMFVVVLILRSIALCITTVFVWVCYICLLLINKALTNAP